MDSIVQLTGSIILLLLASSTSAFFVLCHSGQRAPILIRSQRKIHILACIPTPIFKFWVVKLFPPSHMFASGFHINTLCSFYLLFYFKASAGGCSVSLTKQQGTQTESPKLVRPTNWGGGGRYTHACVFLTFRRLMAEDGKGIVFNKLCSHPPWLLIKNWSPVTI